MTTADFLPFSRPTIDEDTIQDVVACLRSGWITTGPRVQQFEENLKNYFNAPYAFTVMSATSGLHLSLIALGIKPGDEVITTSLTFVATLNVIAALGAKPVLVDIDPVTLNIEVNQLRDAITLQTRAIMPVHYAGLPVNCDEIYAIAKEYNLRVIEDAAHAIGASYHNKKIGSFGDIQVFSFHPNKNMTTIEGGCVVTRDEEFAKKFSQLRFHGINREAWNRFGKNGSQHYDVMLPGLKSNMSDVQAAVGIHQLAQVDGFNARRRELAQRYYDAFKNNKALTLPVPPSENEGHCWHLYCVQINPENTSYTRDTFMEALKDRGIGTGLHYLATHLFSYYQNEFGYRAGDFPKTEQVCDRIMSLPLFPTLTNEQQDRVISTINELTL
jgi:dTDP-4-amino-4,6-dideoxygalactose transaminase